MKLIVILIKTEVDPWGEWEGTGTHTPLFGQIIIKCALIDLKIFGAANHIYFFK